MNAGLLVVLLLVAVIGILRAGASVAVGVMPGSDGWSRVRLSPAGPGVDDGELSRFRASMLAALRARDPSTRHG